MHRFASFVVLGLLAACGDTPSDPLMSLAAPDELAQIRGGSNDATQRGVVGLAMLTGGGSGGCTGSLIADNVVLTARHCIADLGNSDRGVNCNRTTAGPSFEPRQVYITLEPALSQSPRAYVGVERIVTPDARLLCNSDIALLKLERRIRPNEMPLLVPRIDAEVRDEESFTIIGYGGTDDQGNGAGQRRIRADRRVTCVGSSCPRWSSGVKEWGGNGGVCKGDSGGPAVDRQGRVIGVASRGGQGCSSSIYSSVAAWGDWISGWVIEFTREEDFEIPLWADGWPTDPAYNARTGDLCSEPSECGYGDCVDGYCTRKCDNDAHCPVSYDCHNGWCLKIPQPVGTPCDLDVECESEACADGVCTEWCDNHSDCPQGYGCNESGRCDEGVARPDEAAPPSVSVPSPFGCTTGGAGLWLLPLLVGLRRRR